MSWLLPPELWTQIFSLLPGTSLCSVSLVSRHFRDLASDPGLWRNVTVSRETIQRLGLQSLLECERLRLVERLDLSYLDLTEAGVESLVRLVGRLEAVSMRYCNLTHLQLTALINSLASARLSELSLDSMTLSQVPVVSLTRAVVARQVINLNNTGLTSSQLVSVLQHTPTSNLTTLTLSGLNMSQLPPDLLQLAVLTVRHLDLANTDLQPHHLTALLSEVIWSNNIEELELTGADLDTDSVSSQLLTDSLACLTSVNLTSSSLNTSQLVSVLTSPSLDWSTLSHLNLSTLDLTSLPSSLLATTSSALTSLKINYSKVSTEQLTALIRAIVRAERLEVLEMTRQDLSPVSVRDCVRLMKVRSLTSLQCNYCNLTAEITMALVTSVTRPASGIKHLGMVRSDLTRIPSGTLLKARNNLQHFNINYCKLTQHQRAALKS